MAGSQGQARNVPPDDFDNVLRSFHEWMHQKSETDRNRRKVPTDRNNLAGEISHISPSIAPGPSIVPNREAIIEEISGNKSSFGRRIFRTFAYGLAVAALPAIAWQAYQNDAIKRTIIDWERSSLAWFSSQSLQRSSGGKSLAAASIKADQEHAVAQAESAPELADVSPAVQQQQLQAVASDLAIVRRTAEQIASKQEQMAQDIASLQASERDVTQKISSLAQAAAAARKNAQKAAHPERANQRVAEPLPVPEVRTPPPPQ
jgi:hypothetical protein